MSTKFLTWTKGQSYPSKEDRKHVSAGIVPIPVECISIRGMEYGRSEKRSSKMKRRPIPLEFDTGDKSPTGNNSFALHDAAIKSATSLMAVMNDVLKSPHLSAHLLSAQQAGGLQPMVGRPRSRTAPPTPMFEAPPMEPVELPGSFPVWPSSYGNARALGMAKSSNDAIGSSIERPHSSPQSSSYAFHDTFQHSTFKTSRSGTNGYPSAGPLKRESQNGLSGITKGTVPENALTAPQGEVAIVKEMRSSLESSRGSPCNPHRPLNTEEAPSTIGESNPPGESAPLTNKISNFDESGLPMDMKAMLERISLMRQSHEAHISSLRQAHDREIESHKSYIALLENCSSGAPEPQQPLKHGLTLDTSHSVGKGSGLLSTNVSASASLQSLDSQLETERRISIESAAAEAEALKRKLSLCRKTTSELGDIRRERDHLRDMNDRSERRIGQLKDIVRKAKESEKTLRSNVQKLEAALLAANIERVDLLEGYYEARGQIRKVHDQEIASEETRNQKKLEKEQQDSVSKLEVSKLQKQLASAEAVRDQYNTLLHAELRRQSKINALNAHVATPSIKDGAAAAVAEKLKSKPGSENAEKRCEFLEKELKHCFQEIILYKLDIRGYRKDLKEANAKVQALQTSIPNRPETPDSMDNRTTDGRRNSPNRKRRDTSGLGISLQSTPTRPCSSSLNTPQQQRPAVSKSSPSASTRTPLELHKKLPEPPVSSRDQSPGPPSTPPMADLNRAETLRSLSESIISSYAKRATPEQVHHDVPPLFRARSSEPPRAGNLLHDPRHTIDAVAVPIMKYTPEMLKTPSMMTSKVVKTKP